MQMGTLQRDRQGSHSVQARNGKLQEALWPRSRGAAAP